MSFILDYIQLGFDHAVLTVNAPISVIIEGTTYWPDSPGYRDALCRPIGSLVAGLECLPDEELRIALNDGSVYSISLLDGDRRSPEAAVLNVADHEAIYSW